jgi:Exonuclease V - a 5' deoxyribonuclease
MVQGHRIHKELEHELHETVNLAHIPNAEEAWGIKFLNILFGLWELNVRGITVRECFFPFLTVEGISSLWVFGRPSGSRGYR